MMMATAAQATEPEKIYVRPNSVTIWQSPEPFKHVFVGGGATKGEKDKEDKNLITAFTVGDLGNRRLIINVREPSENLLGLGEGIIAQGNVLLYDETGKEVAHLIVEVTPLGGSRRVEILQNGNFVKYYQCGGDFFWCVHEFKPKELSAVETKPDGTVRREYK
jgi:hypothetical protein